ncbi:hypothetical protein G5B40_13470 [Pikeienuella piscinae]|uniref:Uncharacterized protein n=1 Tax=Pikeienuella piscinae TaxID=2748098 RepID=A0A7L5BY57_9RHOB|nr:hypothetical protein [Pikeienuella piscinae]QIE56381.1 hypothetical protein G5B40_13470 [Pikeienuella piscinae]
MKRLTELTLTLLVMFAAPAGAAAAEATALIVDSMGAISPPADPLTEAETGARFELGPDAELIVIHYASCAESHFRGGVVEIGALAASGDGVLVGETEIECPRKVAFAESADASASVVLRGDETRTMINARPVFVVLGEGVAEVEIMRAGGIVATLDVVAGMARWPANLDPLESGVDYEIAIPGAGGDRTAPAAVATGAGVTIIQP